MRRSSFVALVAAGLAAGYWLTARPSGPRGLRAFAPDRVAALELDMWQAYYRHERCVSSADW